jgi:hypothetical protein
MVIPRNPLALTRSAALSSPLVPLHPKTAAPANAARARASVADLLIPITSMEIHL